MLHRRTPVRPPTHPPSSSSSSPSFSRRKEEGGRGGGGGGGGRGGGAVETGHGFSAVFVEGGRLFLRLETLDRSFFEEAKFMCQTASVVCVGWSPCGPAPPHPPPPSPWPPHAGHPASKGRGRGAVPCPGVMAVPLALAFPQQKGAGFLFLFPRVTPPTPTHPPRPPLCTRPRLGPRGLSGPVGPGGRAWRRPRGGGRRPGRSSTHPYSSL